ncbi:hypothetical protein FOMPIDRAFT_83166 [Fomitopsis schrenkii]|uniref:NADP-dependent oxidoreductase domain-containing protein n=1 Tax=Fomitopsis schrenkii TaxID=2126942 RepID=S8EK26_FOMSC|nr:hypothetical protein FOMPIDRAFT_83166 [Fomitopsis schrenkii]
MEFSPFERGIEASGFVAAAREMGISVVACSPLGRGLITGRYQSSDDIEHGHFRPTLPRFAEENFHKNLELVDRFRAFAAKHGATPGQMALAWILAEHADFVPIPDSSNVERFEENAYAADIVLDAEDVEALRAAVAAADVRGTHYPREYLARMAVDNVPLGAWKGKKSTG